MERSRLCRPVHVLVQACLRVGRLKEQGLEHPTMISFIKRNSCLKAIDAARKCRDILGGVLCVVC
jgi:glutaryl-CoA dehydrogenase